MPMLILLGAVGGATRGALDLYIQFLNWRSARSRHRQPGQGQSLERGEPQAVGQEPPVAPRFLDYFDPAVDLTAAVVHSAMGAAVAVLFGVTGQISGPYAAIVVGISAPVILTQLARIQSVSEAVGQGAGAAESATQPVPPVSPVPAVPAVSPLEGGDYGAPAAPDVTGGGVSLPAQPSPTSPYVRPAAVRADGEAAESLPCVRPAAVRADGEAAESLPCVRPAAVRAEPEAAEPQPNGRPVDSAGGTGRGSIRGGRGTSSLPHGQAAGEEGAP
ncbi:hypothetical protein I2W78_12045 [Streptomyces spinoverrucosus]|uniref:hypothetical protein n=1 Tax=Streptomyces spinoverrucosus TaxID=284043 RepID=UPI0018C42F71|nr:hypothetical protein [Streptomyces spinoverrucosus]MBG0852549.1 hypothetical protein [Streptomyces spinoverrucosus]